MSKPKATKITTVAATPTAVPEASVESADDAAKKLNKNGWRSTILTGNVAPGMLVTSGSKKSVLG